MTGLLHRPMSILLAVAVVCMLECPPCSATAPPRPATDRSAVDAPPPPAVRLPNGTADAHERRPLPLDDDGVALDPPANATDDGDDGGEGHFHFGSSSGSGSGGSPSAGGVVGGIFLLLAGIGLYGLYWYYCKRKPSNDSQRRTADTVVVVTPPPRPRPRPPPPAATASQPLLQNAVVPTRPRVLRYGIDATAHKPPPAPPEAVPADGNTCTVCFDQPRGVRFMPCMHDTCCQWCAVRLIDNAETAGKVVTCPQCRAPITAVIHFSKLTRA